MLDITVRGYRGIDSAQLSCSPIGLLMGVNGSAKSSLAQAVAAALTGNAIAESFELAKKDVSEIIRRGQKDAICVVKSEGGEARMSWPACQLTTTGATPPHASIYAAGLSSVPLLSPKDRAAALEQYLHSAPTKDDLHAAMTEKFEDASIEALWTEIQTKGWDACARDYEMARRDTSRDWSRVAGGQSFGSEKSARWKPDGWSKHLEACTIEELADRVVAATHAVEDAIRANATSRAEVDRLRKLADTEPVAKDTLAEALDDERKARQVHDAARAELARLPVKHHALTCPHCGEAVAMDLAGDRLVPAGPAPVIDPEARERAIGVESRTANTLDQKRAAVAEARTALQAAQNAATALADMRLPSDAISGSEALEDRARAALTQAQTDLRVKEQETEASQAYRRWLSANLKHEILIPSGLRAKKLAEVVGAYNSSILAPLCDAAEWMPAVNITEALVIRMGERPYSLLSEGEKWRVRVLLQVAQAMHDGSSMVIVDGVPDIDTPARNGLFALLTHAGLPALICFATIRGLPVPDLAQAGLGGTWLLEGGKASPLNSQVAA